MPKTALWADDLAPRYFQLKALEFTDDEAAAQLKVEFPAITEGLQICTITRQMRNYKKDIQEQFDSYHSAAFAALGADYGEASANPPVRVPPPLGLAEASPVITKSIDIPYEDGHVWNDCHIPNHNSELMEHSLSRAKKQGIKNLYIGGDFMDMPWASKFVSWGQNGPVQVKQEFEIAKQIINAALDVFENIYIIPGNHDGTRFKYMSNGSLGFENLMIMVLGDSSLLGDRIHIGERRYMILRDSPWGDWRITHPVSARAVPLSLAQTIALKERQNVITAHQHYLGLGFDRYGHYILCDGGHMTNEELTEYKKEVDSSHSNWTPGYVELVDGWPTLQTLPPGGR